MAENKDKTPPRGNVRFSISLSEEQKRAKAQILNHPFNFVIGKAGSGKTFSLVKAYLKVLLQSKKKEPFKNILAITFTNKAANEMKERIFENLILLAEDFSNSSDHIRCKEANNLLEDYAQFIGIPKLKIKEKSK